MEGEQTAREALAHVANGDAQAITVLRRLGHAMLLNTTDGAEPLVVTREATISVLRGLLDGRLSPTQAQGWASFVRCGYLEGTTGPVQPLPIDFESAWEDAIAEATSRLDEIGDLIDGEVSNGELLDLLQLLGVAD